MKKFFICCFLAVSFFSATAYCQEGDFVIPKNEEVILDAHENTKIIVNDVYSLKTKLKRNVRIVDEKTYSLVGEVFITLESSDPESDLYHQIENEPGKFSGVLKIEADGKVLYYRKIVDGAAVTGSESTGGTERVAPGPVYNPNVACSFGNIHDCVAYKIDDMSWWKFGLCLVRAPACYGGLWATCTISVCINHMEYPD